MTMENITRMKNALQQFQQAAKKAADEIARNNEIYQHDAALEANKAVAAKRTEVKDAAHAEIEAAAAAGKAKAETWARLDGSKITDDAKLLQFGMTPAQFSELAARNKNNGTMITLLAQYGKEQNEKTGASLYNHPEKHYPVEALPSLEKKIDAYEKYRGYALRLLNNVEEHPELPGIISEIENFAVRHPGTPSPLLDAIQ